MADIRAKPRWHLHCDGAQWSRSVALLAPTHAACCSSSTFGFFSPDGRAVLPAMVDSSQVCSAIWVGRARRCAVSEASRDLLDLSANHDGGLACRLRPDVLGGAHGRS